ncbi:MAG: YigZ family protein [Planctomycetota bacterium]|jgi:uncharacterized YigZ family protein|nr:YigZ family protein [Planctomycetota bacterium]
MANEEFLTPAGYGEALLVEKRSKFISRIWPVETEAKALELLEGVRKKHWDATHNVYAYVIRGGATRYSDDGEPHGTSGMPTLGVIQGRGVVNALCVVTRYFGGALLGAGGLVRAYSGAAGLALDAAGFALVRRWRLVLIPAPYALFEQIKILVEKADGVIEATDFGVDALIEAMIPPENTAALFGAIGELSSGRVAPEVIDTVFRSVGVQPGAAPKNKETDS